MNTQHTSAAASCCNHCPLAAICRTDPQIAVRRITAGHELPLRRRMDGSMWAHVVCAGCLKTVHHARDGRTVISALHLPGELVQPASGRRGRIHHEATCDTVVRSRHVDTGTEPGLASRLLASTDRRIARDGARIVRLAGGRPVPSLSAMILDLLDRGCGEDAGADVLRMPISRAEVASYLGFEPETVSRAFAALKRSGTILRHGWATVDVVDRARLHALSEV